MTDEEVIQAARDGIPVVLFERLATRAQTDTPTTVVGRIPAVTVYVSHPADRCSPPAPGKWVVRAADPDQARAYNATRFAPYRFTVSAALRGFEAIVAPRDLRPATAHDLLVLDD